LSFVSISNAVKVPRGSSCSTAQGFVEELVCSFYSQYIERLAVFEVVASKYFIPEKLFFKLVADVMTSCSAPRGAAAVVSIMFESARFYTRLAAVAPITALSPGV
jgi:hypothetical protein